MGAQANSSLVKGNMAHTYSKFDKITTSLGPVSRTFYFYSAVMSAAQRSSMDAFFECACRFDFDFSLGFGFGLGRREDGG
jgi:hypothetical protein